jgi:hypothetical protein
MVPPAEAQVQPFAVSARTVAAGDVGADGQTVGYDISESASTIVYE